MTTTEAKREAIRSLFRSLEGVGYERPMTWRGDNARERIESAVEIWDVITPNLPPQALLAAGLAWMQADRYGKWPKPGQVIDKAMSMGKALTTTGDEGWGLLLALVSVNGTRSTKPHGPGTYAEAKARHLSTSNGLEPFLLHQDPHIAAGLLAGIEAIGGWRKVGMMSDENIAADRASFRSAFEAVTRRREAQHMLLGSARALEAGKAFGLLPEPRQQLTDGGAR